MTQFLGFLIALALVTGGPGLFVEKTDAASEKAMCLVCQVTHGEAEEEAVKATRTYEGKEYGFDAFVGKLVSPRTVVVRIRSGTLPYPGPRLTEQVRVGAP